MSFAGKTVAFVGGGMMGGAMMGGLLQQGLLSPSQIVVSDPNQARGATLTETYGVRYTDANAEATDGASVIVLAVKPQFFGAVAAQLREAAPHADFVLSIMAGVTVATIQQALGVERVVRAMPNTPAAVGQGMSAWFASESVDADAQALAEQMLAALGETLRVPSEPYLDVATAVSGSGPAYVFLFMEAMIDAAVHMGFARADAEKLVLHTVAGSAAYALESGQHITALRNAVTSPSGTTAEALYHMEQLGLRNAVARGMWGALQRARALGGGEGRNPDTSE